MTKDALTAADARPAPVVRGEAEWRALMAEYEHWDGTQVAFCRARGISRKTFHAWRRRFGLAHRPKSAGSGRFVEIAPASAPGWDVELELGGGVVLRLRRS